MAITVDQGNSRQTAILIFVIAVILIYLLGFHWFILRHVDVGREISELSEQLDRFQRVAGKRDEYEQQLQSLQSSRSDQNLFLEQGDFNEAAAEMSERLSQMVNAQADESCQIVSRQPVRPRVQERFEKVTVNVRMRCNVEDLMRIVYTLESGVPLVIVDEMTVIKPRARRRVNNRVIESQQALDIRFNMSGYLRIASPAS
jgi:general secretion pathway protein M